jgi:putative PIN family toxin of toxin-antitoxin system
MIVVLDTNVWVSALHFSRQDGTVYLAVARAIRIDTIAICSELEDEIARILHDHFLWPSSRVSTTLTGMTETALRVTLHGTVRVCRDPQDDMILECAERAKAELIVTGDKDLLVLGAYKNTRIVTPSEYFKL